MLHIKVEFLLLENWIYCTPFMPWYNLLSASDELPLPSIASNNSNRD